MDLTAKVTLTETGCAFLEGKSYVVPGIPSIPIPDGFLADTIAGLISSQTADATATLSIVQNTTTKDWDIDVKVSATLPEFLNSTDVGPWSLSYAFPSILDGLISDVKAAGGIPSPQTITAKLAWVAS